MSDLADRTPQTPDAGGVPRRLVLAGAGALATITVVGCGSDSGSSSSGSGYGASNSDTGSDSSSAPASGSGTPLAKVTDIPDGSGKAATVNGKPVILVRSGTTVTALSAICTHRGCTVAAKQDELVCPCHGSRYDLTGKVTNGPAPRPLVKVNVTVRNGEVYAT